MPKETVIVLNPRHDRVHVKEREAAKVTKGGLIIPENVREEQKTILGDVVAVGTGKLLENGTRVEIDLQPGDVVMYGRFAGSDLKVGEHTFKILRDDEILATVTETEVEVSEPAPEATPES